MSFEMAVSPVFSLFPSSSPSMALEKSSLRRFLFFYKDIGYPVPLLASFVGTQTTLGLIQAGFREDAHPCRHELPLSLMIVIEFTKAVVAIGLLYRESRISRVMRGASRPHEGFPEETLPLHTLDEDEGVEFGDLTVHAPRRSSPALPRHVSGMLVLVAALIVLRHHLTLIRRLYANQRTLHVFDGLLILFVGMHSSIFMGRSIPRGQWTSALLQVAASLLIHYASKTPHYTAGTYAFLLLLCGTTSIILVIVSTVYQMTPRTVSVHAMNLLLFTACFIGYILTYLITQPNSPTVRLDARPRDLAASIVVIILHVFRDFTALAVLRETSSPLTFTVLSLVSASLLPALTHKILWSTIGFTNLQWIGTVLAVYAASTYLLEGAEKGEDMPTLAVPTQLSRRSFAFLGLTLAPFLLILACSPMYRISHSPSTPYARLTEPLPHQLEAAATATPSALGPGEQCIRHPLPSSSAYLGAGEERPDFHAFDDVLLVVFFSHDRYDVNLDSYRQVYSAYFPNILFIGPASREDRGFAHSYDVVLDSYMAGDDYDAGWIKLSGRMAHHMTYTAVKDHPCYSGGYLIAPFDALLNVPRLMQFPQDRIWYHTPFESVRRYVPNSAVKGVQDETMHPPGPMISERTAEEYLEESMAWGAGWHGWWGERHVGMQVCMQAYDRLPHRMRQRFEGLVGAPGRLLSGSADTVYLPAHLRADFLDTLGTFLMTECFLEIVVPTTMHLILPVDEDIAFVDHWWKTEPPLNTSYVRQKWEEGYEVDSFHTFHWGDIQADGFFGPNKDVVGNMRALLADSFRRQGIKDPVLRL
ncbi:hypothetical protein FB45DRAFT_937039 [Roridomyces roridus]|uniref:Uncharacterized protein n=1 Tax=Roridomyces roridus TaxID=1738132 RepID=A0AAD7BA74_9AGAR|nr:hypothetical protein FB45DRAFT_937039 [Roridomyces roridus]